MRMKLLSVLTLICFLHLHVQSHRATSYLERILYTTKTPYELARELFSQFLHHDHKLAQPSHGQGDVNEDADSEGILAKSDSPSQCVARQITIALRHGTRYPSPGDVKRIDKFIKKLQIADSDVAEEYSMSNWHNNFTMNNTRTLTETGARENVDIAHRYAKRFPKLFQTAVTSSSLSAFELLSSDTQRSKASAEAFVKGLADVVNVDIQEFLSKMSLRNDLLRFFEKCSSYLNEIKENADEAMVEFTSFLDGPEMREAAKTVSLRMSKSGNENLISADDLRTMWILCGFEVAHGDPGHTSDWCKPLTKHESRVLEYAFDLKAYWKKAYGYTINYEQACPLLTDMFDNLYQRFQDDSAPKVSLYFGHGESLLPIYSLLGLFQDEELLLASNYLLHKDTRKFRVSLMTPFAANIAFVLYDCEEGPQTSHPDWPDSLDSAMMKVLINEHAVTLPFTDKVTVSLHDFESQYYQYVRHCDFDQICRNDVKKEKSPSHGEL